MTQVLTWNQLHHYDIEEEASLVRSNTTALFNLISGATWSTEIGILKSIVLKITIRLRSARVTMIMNQLMKRIDRYKSMDVRRLISPATTLIFKETIDTRTGNVLLPDADSLAQVLHVLTESASLLRQIIHYTILAFGNSMMWLRLGHLIQHFLPAISAVSRISMITKSLLVFTCDLYHSLYKLMAKLRCNPAVVKSLPGSIDTTGDESSSWPNAAAVTDQVTITSEAVGGGGKGEERTFTIRSLMSLDRDEEDAGVVVPRPCNPPDPIASSGIFSQTFHSSDAPWEQAIDESLPGSESLIAPKNETTVKQKSHPIKYPTRRSIGYAKGTKRAIMRRRAIAGTKHQRILRVACSGRRKKKINAEAK